MNDKKSPLNQMAPGDCILFATADWDEPYWTNKQHCANELVRLGWRVLYIESIGLRSPKATSKKDLKRIFHRFRKGLFGYLFGATEREKNLWTLSPLVIPGAHGHKWIGRLNQILIKWLVSRHIRSYAFKTPLVWTYHPHMTKLLEEIAHRALVYHCVDDLSALPDIDMAHFDRAERVLLEYANIVFVTSTTLKKKCLKINQNVHFHSNVVDLKHFSNAGNGEAPVDLKKIPIPRLIFHGVLSDFKVDFELLLTVAKKRPNFSIVLLGEEREGQNNEVLSELRRTANVFMLGFKNYSELPKYLIHSNVGLLPSKLNIYTKSMFPMKYYEYIAAGLPVVSTPLEFTKSHQHNLLTGSDINSFITAIDHQLLRGKLDLKEVECLVGDNTWAQRMQKMLYLIKETEGLTN